MQILFCYIFDVMVNKNLTPLSKNVEKNKVVHLRLLFTYLHQNLSNIKKHLALELKNICPCSFLFQTILNKAINIFYLLPEWVRNKQMIYTQ